MPIKPIAASAVNEHADCDDIYCVPCGEFVDHCDTVWSESREELVCGSCAEGAEVQQADGREWRRYAYR